MNAYTYCIEKVHNLENSSFKLLKQGIFPSKKTMDKVKYMSLVILLSQLLPEFPTFSQFLSHYEQKFFFKPCSTGVGVFLCQLKGMDGPGNGPIQLGWTTDVS